MRLKRKHIYIGLPFVIIIGLVLSWWYHYATEPVGQMNGKTLTLNGVTYVLQMNAYPVQTKFFHRVGRTQDGDSISAMNGESPDDFVYVIGEMWESLYRKQSLPEPALTTEGISSIVFSFSNGDSTKNVTVKDAKIITDVVHDLHSSSAKFISINTTPSTKMYGVSIYLKKYPGLQFPFLIESKDQDLYFETNMQNNTYVNIERTVFGRWIHEQIKHSPKKKA